MFCALRARDREFRLEWTGSTIRAFLDTIESGALVREVAAHTDLDVSSVQEHVRLARRTPEWKALVSGDLAPLSLRVLRVLRGSGITSLAALQAAREQAKFLRDVRGLGIQGLAEVDALLCGQLRA